MYWNTNLLDGKQKGDATDLAEVKSGRGVI